MLSAKKIMPENFTPTIGAYSHGIAYDLGGTRLLFVTGQIAMGAHGEVVSEDIEEQTHFVFKNVKSILASAGMTFSNVLKVQIFLTDMQDFAKVSPIRNVYLGEAKPASTLIEVSGLVKAGCKIEIEAIAAKELA